MSKSFNELSDVEKQAANVLRKLQKAMDLYCADPDHSDDDFDDDMHEGDAPGNEFLEELAEQVASGYLANVEAKDVDTVNESAMADLEGRGEAYDWRFDVLQRAKEISDEWAKEED